MTKKELIEEMTKIVDEMYNVYTTTSEDIAEGLYNAGYRKIDDDCAVITKAELKQYKVQAVREFAEKLKEYQLESKNLVWDYGVGWLDCYAAFNKAIDELLNDYEK